MANSINVQFRVAAPEDSARIAQLVQAAFRADDSRAGWTANVELNRRFTITTDEVSATISNPNAVILMATTSHGDLAGVMSAFHKNNEVGRLAMLAVDQTYQRSGLGRRILANAEEYAQKTWGVKKIGLNALNTRGSLIEWYERRGYVKTGERSPFPLKAFHNLDLVKDLHFVELEKDVREGECV